MTTDVQLTPGLELPDVSLNEGVSCRDWEKSDKIPVAVKGSNCIFFLQNDEVSDIAEGIWHFFDTHQTRHSEKVTLDMSPRIMRLSKESAGISAMTCSSSFKAKYLVVNATDWLRTIRMSQNGVGRSKIL